VGLFIYYSIFQIVDDVMRISKRTNNSNRIIESLRTEYKVTIRTFHARQPQGFVSFRAIWINEVLFKTEKPLLFTFHHEYYHLKYKHKSWLLFMRFIISLTPLTIYFVNWVIFIGILLTAAYLTEKISSIFEKKANAHARKMTSNGRNE
jgi:hypothetical protein